MQCRAAIVRQLIGPQHAGGRWSCRLVAAAVVCLCFELAGSERPSLARFQSKEESGKTQSGQSPEVAEACEWECVSDQTSSSKGHFVVRPRTAFPGNLASYQFSSTYDVLTLGGCTGNAAPHWDKPIPAYVVPVIDEDSPVEESSLYVYIDPLNVSQLQMYSSYAPDKTLVVCEKAYQVHADAKNASTGDGSQNRKCFCELSLPQVESRLFTTILIPLPESVRAWLEIELDVIFNGCGVVAIPRIVGNYVEILFFLLVAVMVHTALLIRAVNAMERAEAPATGAAERRSSRQAHHAIILPTPLKNFRSCVGRVLGLVLMVFTIQVAMVAATTSLSEPWKVRAFIVVTCVYGVVEVCRAVVVLTLHQLVEAALSQGIAVIEPSPSAWHSILMVVFLSAVVLAAFRELAKAGSLFMAVLGLAGPAWKITNEMKRAFDSDNEEKSNVTISVKALVDTLKQQSSEGASDDDATAPSRLQLGEVLDSGEWFVISMGKMISLGRVGADVVEACTAGVDDVLANEADEVQYTIFDVLWSCRCIYQLTGKRIWMFSIMPLFVVALALLVSITVYQLAEFCCYVPAPDTLALFAPSTLLTPTGFHVYQDRYVVEADRSLAVASLQCSYNQLRVNATLEEHSEELSRWDVPVSVHVPSVAHVRTSLKTDSESFSTYSLHFMPTRIVPTGLLFTTDDPEDGVRYRRCEMWSSLQNTGISLPANTTSFTMEVGLFEYTLGLPGLCTPRSGSRSSSSSIGTGPGVETVYCEFNGASSRRRQSACRNMCREEPSCIDAFPAKSHHACFLIRGELEVCNEVGDNWHPNRVPRHRFRPQQLVSQQAQAQFGKHSRMCFVKHMMSNTSSEGCFEPVSTDSLDTMLLEFARVPFLQTGKTARRMAMNLQLFLERPSSPGNSRNLIMNTHKLWLYKGAATPVAVLAEIETWIGGAKVYLTTQVLHTKGRDHYTVAVSIPMPLNWAALQAPLLLYVVPLIADPKCSIVWHGSLMHIHHEKHQPKFGACSHRDLQHFYERFTVCQPQRAADRHGELGVSWGDWKDVTSIQLDPLRPELPNGSISFTVHAPYAQDKGRQYWVTLQAWKDYKQPIETYHR